LLVGIVVGMLGVAAEQQVEEPEEN